MKGLVHLLLLAILLSGCGDAAKESSTNNNAAIPVTSSDSLYRAVMEVHDVAMARMGEIIRSKARLQQRADSIKALKEPDTAAVAALETAAKDLDYAEELMNEWMRAFDPDTAGETEAEMLAFYTKEKEKVDTVKAKIFRGLERSQELLK